MMLELKQDAKKREELRIHALELALPDASEKIYSEIFELLHPEKKG